MREVRTAIIQSDYNFLPIWMQKQVSLCQYLSAMEPLKKVTFLSKYLAMALFILLPFLGGYIGYTLAREKMVEVNINTKEVIPESIGNTSPDVVLSESVGISDASTISVSFQKVMGWITYALTDEEWVKGEGVFYTNTVDSINVTNRTIYTHEAGSDPTRVEIKKIDDTIDNVASKLLEDPMFSTTTREYVEIPGELKKEQLLKLTRSVTTNDCKWITYLHNITQSTTGVVEITTCPTHSEGYDATKIMVAESVKFSTNQ